MAASQNFTGNKSTELVSGKEEYDQRFYSKDNAVLAGWYDEIADSYDGMSADREYPGHGVMVNSIMTHCMPQLRTNDKITVLDAGCGTGEIGRMLVHALQSANETTPVEIDGFDLSPGLLEKTREKNCYNDLKVVDMKTLPWPYGEEYDIICCNGCVIHLTDAPQIIYNAFAANTKVGGFFVMQQRNDTYNYFQEIDEELQNNGTFQMVDKTELSRLYPSLPIEHKDATVLYSIHVLKRMK